MNNNSLVVLGLGLVFIAIFALLQAIVVMYLWNMLMPIIFKLPTISYWQAYGIILLSNLIFPRGSSSKS